MSTMSGSSRSAAHDRKRRRVDAPPSDRAVAPVPPLAPPASLPNPALSAASSSPFDPRERHAQLVSIYRQYQDALRPSSLSSSTSPPPPPLTDADVLLSAHRLVHPASAHSAPSPSPSQRLALRYYAALYKEYALVDLARPSHPGLRWRTEAEVVAGKGQWTCGARNCQRERGLNTWRVHFGYEEDGAERAVQAKLRLCEDCAVLLHHTQVQDARRHARELRRQQRERRKDKRRREGEEAKEGDGERRVKVEAAAKVGLRSRSRSLSPSLASLLPPPLERPPADEWSQLFP